MSAGTPETILARYAGGPEQLEACLAGLAEDVLDVAPPQGGWTVRQIVHHIVDGDDLWKICIKAALGNSQGEITFRWYWDVPQDVWAERWAYAGRTIAPSLALFRANRSHMAQLLAAVAGAWDRSIRLLRWDGKDEAVTVGQVIEMQVRHLEGHLADILAVGVEGENHEAKP